MMARRLPRAQVHLPRTLAAPETGAGVVAAASSGSGTKAAAEAEGRRIGHRAGARDDAAGRLHFLKKQI